MWNFECKALCKSMSFLKMCTRRDGESQLFEMPCVARGCGIGLALCCVKCLASLFVEIFGMQLDVGKRVQAVQVASGNALAPPKLSESTCRLLLVTQKVEEVALTATTFREASLSCFSHCCFSHCRGCREGFQSPDKVEISIVD